MTIEPLFTVPHAPANASVTIMFEGSPLRVPAGITVAAALLVALAITRDHRNVYTYVSATAFTL